MAINAQDVYLESRIMSADGAELVQILYQAAIESVESARQHLRRGEIAERSRAITKAYDIVTELATSLDHNVGGEFSRTLLELYDYMRRRLLDANLNQADPPLAEVGGLLGTLLEGWTACKDIVKPKTETPVSNPYGGGDPDSETPGSLIAVSY